MPHTAALLSGSETFGGVTESLETVRTFCVSTGDVLPAYVLFPPYTAVMECVPEDKDAVEYVAHPLLRFAEPSVTLLSLKVTVPVALDAVTVAKSSTSPQPRGADLDAVRCAAARYSARIFLLALRHKWGTAPAMPASR